MAKNIAAALVTAQMGMTKATKGSKNPHLKSMYADLGSVMDACLPSLNAAGIAVIQPTGEDGSGRYVETILIHGESGEQISCKVPLILQKNDMQGYGSAVTYARRYGLMAMAGIAPEDDDGNSASKAAPRRNRGEVVDNKETRPDRGNGRQAVDRKTEHPAQDVRDYLVGGLKKQTLQSSLSAIWVHVDFVSKFDSLPETMQNEVKAVYEAQTESFGKAVD